MQSRILRIILALFIAIPGVTLINFAVAASDPQINLCEAGKYASLSGVLTRGAGAQIIFSPAQSEATTFIGAVDPAEAQPFISVPGSNLVYQASRASYDSAQSSLSSVVNSVNSNLSPIATELSSSSLGTQVIGSGPPGTFPAGVYLKTGAMRINDGDTIKLVGIATDKFVFISTEAHNLGAGTRVELSGGAQAKNVYWVVGTSTGALTIGANSLIIGNILNVGTISIGAGSRVKGRILAGNTITYGANSYLEALPSDSSCVTTTTSSGTPVKSIAFIDLTLVDATIGNFYSDSVVAVTKLDGVAGAGQITYAVTAGALPAGLSLNPVTGRVSGTPESSVAVRSYTVTIQASSPDYPNQSLNYTFQTYAASIEKTIAFTDLTLVDATIGNFYSDSVVAVAKIGAANSGAQVTYYVDPGALPAGLTLNTSNGLVSGTPLSSARIGTYTATVWALSTGYPNQSLNYTFQTYAASIEKTIAFTDLTLVDATIGNFYSDSVVAVAKIGAANSGAQVTYSVEAGTPLPTGLWLNPATGLVSGTPVSSARIGTHTSIIWAHSSGYPSKSFNYTFETYAASSKLPATATPLQTSFGTPVNTLMMTALFANNSSKLSLQTKSAIKSMTVKMKTLNIATLTVAGYASANGSTGHLKLSIARAKAVAAVLASNGVKTKISIKGLGVLPSLSTKNALAQSRKAEIWVLQKA